jgi:hypothetical protein
LQKYATTRSDITVLANQNGFTLYDSSVLLLQQLHDTSSPHTELHSLHLRLQTKPDQEREAVKAVNMKVTQDVRPYIWQPQGTAALKNKYDTPL